jgi:hypothetical protein
MHKLDINMKMKLLAGLPIGVSNIGGISPKTLREISVEGYTEFMRHLGILTLDAEKSDIFKSIKDIDLSKYTILEIAFGFGGELFEMLHKAVEFFCGIEVISDFNAIGFNVGNTGLLTKDNYKEFVSVIKLQCCLNGEDELEEEFKPANDKAREIIEKLKKTREMLKEAKASDESRMDISDIISAVSAKSNAINKFNVWDLTLYQLYDEYNRLRMIDEYYTSIKALMAGAEKVELVHWSERFPEPE